MSHATPPTAVALKSGVTGVGNGGDVGTMGATGATGVPGNGSSAGGNGVIGDTPVVLTISLWTCFHSGVQLMLFRRTPPAGDTGGA